jgi:hypothetical protein
MAFLSKYLIVHRCFQSKEQSLWFDKAASFISGKVIVGLRLELVKIPLKRLRLRDAQSSLLLWGGIAARAEHADQALRGRVQRLAELHKPGGRMIGPMAPSRAAGEAADSRGAPQAALRRATSA